MQRYDATVIGLGGMGSAAAAHLARRGVDVIGLDRFPLLHALGSSTGRTRIIRKAYFEDLAYVPLLERAYQLWHDLEKTTKLQLLDLCGVLVVGSESESVTRGVLRASREYDIPVDLLGAADIRKRYPQMRPLDDEIGVFEPGAGIVFPENAVAAHLDLALAHGATLAGNVNITGWNTDTGGRLIVEIDDVPAFETSRIIVCAGAWTPATFARLGLPITIQRNVQYWFHPTTPAFARESFPAYFLDRPGLPAPLYGFPDLGGGIKAAFHAHGDTTSANELNRDVAPGEVDRMRRALDAWIPGAAGALAGVKVCMYSMTPDQHFAIGRDPQDERVVIAAGFSGHGFKFASVIGEILSQLALDNGTELNIGFLSPSRFERKV